MYKSVLFRLFLLVTILAMAGPELAIALEFIVLLDVLGLELIAISISVPLMLYGRLLLTKIEKLDPYFFIATRKNVFTCPALLAHAVPFFIVSLFVLASSALFSFLIGE